MADRPILFSAPMVRALLAGTKTQTRRILKPQPELFETEPGKLCEVGVWPEADGKRPRITLGRCITRQTIPCAAGDRLWVRESGQLLREAYDHDPRAGEDLWRDAGFYHSADGEIIEARSYDPPLRDWIGDCAKVSRPSIHMPRWASRLTLTVTDVRVQRLQDISEEDAFAEGIDTDVWDMAPVARRYGTDDGWFVGWPTGIGEPCMSVDARTVCRRSYATLWDLINGAGAWSRNDWVVAYTFTVECRNIDMGAPHV